VPIEFPEPELVGSVSAVAIEGPAINWRKRYYGLYMPTGVAVPHSDVHTGELITEPEDEPELEEAELEIEGPVLFAGYAPFHFGRVILNSIGRLWALDHLPSETKLLYITKHWAKPDDYPSLKPVLNGLGIRNDLIVTREPLIIDQTYTATDLFGARFSGLGSPEFFNWIQTRFPTGNEIEAGKSVYVSRGGLGPNCGRFASEDHLERLLKEQGYQIYTPEAHDLQHQIATYQTAERLIFAEGSAINLFGLVKRAGQNVAIIQRREDIPRVSLSQLNGRPGGDAVVSNNLREVFWPPMVGDDVSVSLLDFSKLRDDLIAGDFISADIPWHAPSSESETESLNAGLDPGEAMLDLEGRNEYLEELKTKRAAEREAFRDAS
jgi:hypothetical protein